MKIESQGILIKGSYCISREPFKMSAGEIWLDSSEIQSIEAIPINGVYGDHPEFLRGGALVAVCNTGASFVLGIFNKHKYNLIANLADAVKAKEKLEKFLGQRFNEVDKIKEAERSIPEIGIRWTAETTIEDVRYTNMNEKDKQLEEKAKRIFLDSFAELLENGGCDDEMFKAVIVSTVTPSGDPEIALRGNGNTLLAMTAGILIEIIHHIAKESNDEKAADIYERFVKDTREAYQELALY